MKKLEKLPLYIIALLQALSLLVYIGLVGLLMSGTENWLGQAPNFLGISFFLTVFTTSALISAVLTLGYPAYLSWKNKKISHSIKLVLYTIGWLVLFIFLFIVSRTVG